MESRPTAPGPRAFVLTGPTAVGKSAVAVPLARALGGEIISADSRQLYRGLDVGTAKPGLRERARARHHGLDLLDPDRPFSAGAFARFARERIGEIRGRGRVPLLVGGTGFFLRALLEPIFREPEMEPERRRALRRLLGRTSPERLRIWVRRLDPERAPVAEAGGPHRIVRTLEVALLTGRPLSWWHRHAPPEAPPLPAVVVVLHLPLPELYRRLERRADEMWEGGLVEEVERLRAAGYGAGAPGMNATGYREVLAFLGGEVDEAAAREATKRATRRYARRQMTWFRHQLPPGARWLDASRPRGELVRECVRIWREAGGGFGRGAPEEEA